MKKVLQKVLIAGAWRDARANGSFQAIDPATGELLPRRYPVSGGADIDALLQAGAEAARELEKVPRETIARFLERYADRLDSARGEIVEIASRETALPASPRLAEVELPRTTDQLRQAAIAVRDRGWAMPTVHTATNVRSMLGPGNFPLAFNSVSGGDFAAAIAAGNSVIAKAHPGHPHTSQLLAEAALDARHEAGLPPGSVQLVYGTSNEDGARLVSHPLVGATGYTGSRAGGLALKAAADAAGKPIYLEMSSINPVFVLPGALRERPDAIAGEFHASALLGGGQFCTNPGIVVLCAGDAANRFVEEVQRRFDESPVGVLLGTSGVEGLQVAVRTLREAGAELLTGGEAAGPGCRFRNTLLRMAGNTFLADPKRAQTEAFGNANLFVIARDEDQMVTIANALEGNLTGCIYSDPGGADDALYDRIAAPLRRLVGRLLDDKMPTGVAVVPSMNQGGPFPATGHPGFTAVGIPAALRRFAMLRCYDNVRPHRLPPELRDGNPTGAWRFIDGEWTRD